MRRRLPCPTRSSAPKVTAGRRERLARSSRRRRRARAASGRNKSSRGSEEMASPAVHKAHPYHMVEPSPWPALGTVAALTLAIGGIWFMHDGPPWVLLAGFAILLATFYLWWRDVVRESRAGIYHTEEVNHGLRVGFLLFIASEVMFFFAFFWAFFNASLPAINIAAHTMWPP